MHRDKGYFDFVERTFTEDVRLLKKRMKEIKQELESRKDLRRYSLSEMESDVSALECYLNRINHWAPGYKSGVDKRRSDMERELLELKKEERMERLAFWKDVALLEKELLSLLREYRKAMRKKELLD